MNTASKITHHSLPGPHDISRMELPNGIILLVRTNQISPSVSFSGYLHAGSLYDPLEKLGLSAFTAAGLMRGTVSRTFQQIYNELETVGASLGFSSSAHTVGFGGRSLAEDLPMMLLLLDECLQQPIFPAEEVERLRAMALTSFAIRAQDTAGMASLTFDETLFAGHPYAVPEDGNKETVLKILPSDLTAFHQNHFGPRGMVLSIAGAVTASQAFDLVSQSLGNWFNPRQPAVTELPAVLPLSEPVRRHIFIPGKTQVDLVLGGLGPKRTDPDFKPASIGNHILGQFGMMGRIGDIVREKSGLAYSASTSLNGGISAGSWEFSAGVSPENVQKVIDLMIKEVERFITEPVSQEELQDTKSAYIGSLPLGLESNAGVARSILNMERYQLGLDYLLTFAEQINAITADMVLESAQRHLNPERFVTISAGPHPIEV